MCLTWPYPLKVVAQVADDGQALDDAIATWASELRRVVGAFVQVSMPSRRKVVVRVPELVRIPSC